MGKAPDEIRSEIDETRERMADTADAIRYRADVKTRTKDAVAEKKDGLVDKIGAAVSRVTGKMPSPGDVTSEAASVASSVGDAATSAAGRIGDALPSTDQIKRQSQQAVSVAQENPIGLTVGAAAAGFLVGMLVPRTRLEDERIGELSDQVKQQALDLGQEAIDHGKAIASETLDQGRDLAQDVGQRAVETARDTAKEHGQELSQSAMESAKSLATENDSASEREEAAPNPQGRAPGRG